MMLVPTTQDQKPKKLSKLREDLQLIAAPAGFDGAPTWLISDPMRHSFFRIGQAAFEILSGWSSGDREAVKLQATQRLMRPVSEEEIDELQAFLVQNELAVVDEGKGWRALAGVQASQNKGMISKVVHNYLFMRIPLARPQPFLDAAWPFVRWIFSTAFVVTIALLAVISLYLVSRQWDVFTATLASFLTFDAFFSYGLALVGIKLIHEMGHAFMAKKYGVAVPTVGVALIVLFPILYTDTTAGWKVGRRERLMMDAAGIFAELTLAVIATLFWVFLPDGTARSIAFVTATASWVMSLGVNLNPFMRFDGYYILSDLMNFENMQARGFALARWRLREFLFGLGDPVPETLPAGMRRRVILHAWGTWIYRFFLFLGIAILVYHFFIKLVGIGLFIVEMVWFIGLPIYGELKTWYGRRGDLRFNWPVMRTLLILAALLFFFFVPWQRHLNVPAIAGAGQVTQLFPQQAAQIVNVNVSEGDAVRGGEPLYSTRSPDLEDDLARADKRIELLEVRLDRTVADLEDRSSRGVILNELAAANEERAALAAIQETLTIRAPHDGVLVNAPRGLNAGQWISATNTLGLLRDPSSQSVVAFLDAERIKRVNTGAKGRFIPDDIGLPEFDVELEMIGLPSNRAPQMQPLLDIYGGLIVSEPGKDGEGDTARRPHYQLALKPLKTSAAPSVEIRGVVRLRVDGESIAARVARRVAGVLIRESGF